MAQTQGTVIILDMGQNASSPEKKNDKSFFEKARECTARLIELKILSEGNNVIAIVLLGSQKTSNGMASKYDKQYKYIETLSEFLSPTWQMIEDLPVKATEREGDWFESILVAVDLFKTADRSIKFCSKKKIILMTNFKQALLHIDLDSMDLVLTGIKEDDFEIDVIGPDSESELMKETPMKIAKQLAETSGGVLESFENTMQYLLFHKKRFVKPWPWNVDLSIGPNIKIPVTAYVRLKDEPAVKNWQKAVKDPITNAASATEAVVKTKEYINPNNQKVDESEKITGYHYGQKIIPFSDCDKSMLYQPGEKCLSVYGFTSAQNITWQNLNGDGLNYLFGRKGDKNAQKFVRCLVECLLELKLVGIVRKVHNNNNAPKMFALMPVIDSNNFVCLSLVGLCYKEDIKLLSFPTTNLKKYNCSEEQVNAFVDLINAMDLTQAYDETFDDTEAFPVAECVSPAAQYVLDCLAFRARNPFEPLPKPRDEIMNLFEVPPEIVKNAKVPLEKIKKLFPLTKIEHKPKRNKNIGIDIDLLQPITGVKPEGESEMPKVQLPSPQNSITVTNISTVNPIADFKALKRQNKALAELVPEMIKVIEHLIQYNVDGNYSKALEAIKLLRCEYVKDDPTAYNTWMQKLKASLESDKKDVLNLIIENKASFILKEENELSTYENENSHEESQLYENDTVPQSAELTISSEVQNMFDD